MDYLLTFSIIALAALIHASFQLGISMVTLLSGHAAGRSAPRGRSLGLIGAFLFGTLVMTSLIISMISYVSSSLFHQKVPTFAWSAACGVMIAIGIAVWTFYYRRGGGTSLWIPRGFAQFLTNRIKATRSRTEAFSLGMSGVLSELIFIIGPTTATAFSLVSLPPRLQLLGTLLYVFVASLGMIIVTILIGSGHSISRIQRWRETNKRFLQFAAGSGLVILGFYLYANEVVTDSISLLGGR